MEQKLSAWAGENWRFFILPALVALVALLAVGLTGRYIDEFLRQLNGATVQLLGFTGIILSVASAAYYSSRRDMAAISQGWFQLGQDPKAPPPLKQKAANVQKGLARKIKEIQATFRRCFNALVLSASAFAALVIIGLLHTKAGGHVWFVTNGIFFFIETFLLVFGAEMLLIGLYILSRVTFWDAEENL